MDYTEFLHEIHGGKPDNAYINIWVLNTKLSHFTRDIDEAADYIDSLKNKKYDIYVACGLYKVKLRKTLRGDKKKVIGIPGLYMDIDFLTKDKSN